MNLSRLANLLVSAFEKNEIQPAHGIDINPVISELASWYEKLRNAMDYREEEVVRRAAIERILKRRLFFWGSGEKIAPPLIRELLWARYFPESIIEESEVARVAKTINLYLKLREELHKKEKEIPTNIDQLLYYLLSAKIETMLNKDKSMDLFSTFLFHILQDHISILDDTPQNRDLQIFLGVRRSFAKDDIGFLKFRLFEQYFGELKEENLASIVANFPKVYKDMEKQLAYPLKDRIASYVKKQIPSFLIMVEIFRKKKGDVRSLIANPQELKNAIYKTAEERYKTISTKVRNGIIRAVFFILLTKVIFAFSIEATYDNLVFGHIIWKSLAINIFTPPLIMVLVSLFIRTPDIKNTNRIYAKIQNILFTEKPLLDKPMVVTLKPEKRNPVLDFAFKFFWLLAFALSFGIILFVLDKLQFNIVSKGIFVFFLAIVSFFTYRISQTANVYAVWEKEALTTPIIDFLFMPIVQVGRRFTEGLSQINIFLYVFDYLIETPFKELFGFLEQWFFFLRTKREELG